MSKADGTSTACRDRGRRWQAAARSTISSSAACSTTRLDRATASSTSRPAPAAPRRATGPRCCCASTSSTARRKGFQTELLEETAGDVAGIRSATHQGRGRLRVRAAAHRDRRAPAGAQEPVRLSGGRHTSFASLFVYPEVDDSIEIEINPADVRTDTFRASGAGGQHINKTDSAVRLTHIPTGIVVQCQNDRSQHRNRDEAWQMLRSRLYEHELRKRMASSRSSKTPRPTSAGATRSGATCSTRAASRTCAPTSRSATPRRCSTATSIPSSRPA